MSNPARGIDGRAGGRPDPPVHYELVLSGTAAGTGYCTCQPAHEIDFEHALSYLRTHPCDDFMHRHLLKTIAGMPPARVERLVSRTGPGDPVLKALLLEAVLLVDALHPLTARFEEKEAAGLSAFTPAVFIKSALQPDQALHAAWAGIFGANILALQPLPDPDDVGLPPLFADGGRTVGEPAATGGCPSRLERPIPATAAEMGPAPGEAARAALDRLASQGRLEGPEMRHEASLSPWALLRKWRLAIEVKSGRHDYTLGGTQIAYGRGLTLDAARASCLMEIVERASAFAAIGPHGPIGLKGIRSLVRGRLSELRRRGADVLDPDRLHLEAPYGDAPLFWVQGRSAGRDNERPVLVPAQSVFLFCNLDEISLFSGLGSTGLASGSTVAQARGSALLEIIERDAVATTLYDPSRCFRLSCRDEFVARLLEDYRYRGIDVFFQDLTAAAGIPCFAAMAVLPDGSVAKGTGAHLDGRRALLAALTETPYPYPYGPASRPAPEGIAMKMLEDLPDYATGSPAGDLERIEALLAASGYDPVYVDLTREDLGFPVVKALVPGLEIMADFDRFSRVSPRLWRRYRALAHARQAGGAGPECH